MVTVLNKRLRRTKLVLAMPASLELSGHFYSSRGDLNAWIIQHSNCESVFGCQMFCIQIVTNKYQVSGLSGLFNTEEHCGLHSQLRDKVTVII